MNRLESSVENASRSRFPSRLYFCISPVDPFATISFVRGRPLEERTWFTGLRAATIPSWETTVTP